MRYNNGDIFQGEYRGGIRVGKGTYFFSTGETIEGEWFGDLTVRGTITYTNGDIYSGQIYKAQKHGLGSYTYSNGCEYRGYWRNDLKHGEGQFWNT